MNNSEVESEIVIEMEKLSKVYGDGREVYALREIDLKIVRGTRIAIMGPSGSGKSTLLNIIGGLDEPSSGTIRLAGTDMSKLSDDARTRLRRERIGMIFQTFNLLPTLSAVENVCLPLRFQGTNKREAESRALQMLTRVGLAARANHRPDELSGGERQRIAIARALIFQPPLLLADEPTGNLDSNTGEEILNLLDELYREFNTTIILVTHNISAADHCDLILTLRDGRIIKQEAVKKMEAVG